RNMTPQGSAKIRNLPNLGFEGFDTFGLQYFTSQAASARTTPIAGSLLTPGDGLVVVTNSGHTVKALVMANNSGSLYLRFLTYGADGGGVPAVVEVLN